MRSLSYVDDLSAAFIRRHERDCAHILMRWWQVAWYLALLTVLLFEFAYRWDVMLCILNFSFAFIYFSVILLRSCAIGLSLLGCGTLKISDHDVAMLKDEDLPVYTILVPLYKESNIAGKIVKNLMALDYPRDKLDVKLLLEADDAPTRAAIAALDLPACFETIMVPDMQPKTKPRACNHGLARTRGKYCVIYDAEDRPEPDQLKKVLIAFTRVPSKVVCIQARLNFYNPRQNLLTKWFTIEYSTTFDLYLPGLQMLGIPMPLGGTSNHFRTSILKSIQGWDPFNVTEDCDLGVRIYKLGFRTSMVESTTWEEANPRLWNWIRQRSRWVKGFFQTHLTHMRYPVDTLRRLGPWGLFGFLLTVGGSAIMMVLNLFFWLIGGLYGFFMLKAIHQGYTFSEVLNGPRAALMNNVVWPMIYAGPQEHPVWRTLSITFFAVTCTLLLANLLFILMHVMACLKRRLYDLIPHALFMPLYWVLISLGALKGYLQLFTNPFYWEKTEHGLDEAT